jgi:hypothetical protein
MGINNPSTNTIGDGLWNPNTNNVGNGIDSGGTVAAATNYIDEAAANNYIDEAAANNYITEGSLVSMAGMAIGLGLLFTYSS